MVASRPTAHKTRQTRGAATEKAVSVIKPTTCLKHNKVAVHTVVIVLDC